MKQLLKVAIQQHRQGQLNQAEATYRQVLGLAPDNADALHFLGVLMHQKGESRAGAQLIRKAIKRSPDYADAHKNLGNVLKESGQLEKAEKCYRKAVELHSADADAQNNLCVVLRLQKRHEDAIEAGLNSVNLNPENPVGWLNFGTALKDGGMLESAVAAFYRALALDRAMVEAHIVLCQTLYRLEKTSETPKVTVQERLRAYQDWLVSEPENPLARFMLAACTGDESMPRAPDQVVKNLFDRFAINFDQTLASLDYRVPDLIKSHLQQVYPNCSARLIILDAGCGTGLCGAFLKPLADSLSGVDLSSGMLDLARRRGLYDDLLEAELTAYLQQSNRVFDLIVCADTLCYFGNLGPVISAARDALKPGGRFVFSLEHQASDVPSGYRINTSGRYSHNLEYVRNLLRNGGFPTTSIAREVLRKEAANPVQGLILDAR